jgi:hypothetical protein
VVDHFQLTELANDALTKVHRWVTWELMTVAAATSTAVGQPAPPADRLGMPVGQKLCQAVNRISAEDSTAQILSASTAKWELRTLLSTVRGR